MDKKSVVIAGLGLLGGSLGLALKDKYFRIGWARRQETLEEALTMDAVDAVENDLPAALGKADIVVLALPVPVIVEFLPLCRKFCKADAVITDIGSIKGQIITAAEASFTESAGPWFVGSHPMAGTEKSRLSAAFAALYDNADVFITPSCTASAEAVDRITELWQSIRCHTSVIDAEHHDILVASTSHVLHVVASALASSILGGKSEEEKRLRFRGCATGFRDTCRIASSSPLMWREIISSNREAVLAALGDFEKSLAEFHKMIEADDFDRFEEVFARGKELRDQWLDYKNSNLKQIQK